MTLIDEFTRECLAIRVARRINSFGVIETMADVMLERGVPEHIRSDNSAEMTAKIVRGWFAKLGATTLYIEPGSPWENGYCKSFNGKLRDECLNGEIFYSLKEASIVIEQWRKHYNTIRPHSSLNYHRRRRHHRPKCFIWIGAHQCSSLYTAGLWVADITYIAIATGFVYLAAILDAWSRRAVGYAISRAIDARVAVAALKTAIRVRQPPHVLSMRSTTPAGSTPRSAT